MDTQTPIDYWQLFSHLMNRRSALVRQRDEAEVELAKMKQIILTVFAMLSEEQQKANQQAVDDVVAESAGIQDAIKIVFSLHSGEWLSASSVRDYLADSGFDFRSYKANPLSSIATTLKRLADTGYLQVKSGASTIAPTTLYVRNDPVTMISNNAIADRIRGLPANFVPPNTPATDKRYDAMHRAMARKPRKSIGQMIAEDGNDK